MGSKVEYSNKSAGLAHIVLSNIVVQE